MRYDNSIARELAARQIDGYLSRRAWTPGAAIPTAEAPRSTITISFQTGVPATRIAEQVARELGFQVFDREVLEVVGRDTGLGNKIVEALDQGKRSALDSWIQGWIDLDHRIIDPQSFHHLVSRVIRGISLHGRAIILGRGANFVLRGTGSYKVRLIADLDSRAESLAAETKKDPDWAREEISHRDRQKAKFIREYFTADVEDPAAYDVTLNLPSFEPERASRQILAVYREAVRPAMHEQAVPAAMKA